MTTIRAINQFRKLIYKKKAQNMLTICLVFLKSEPQYACKRYAYKKKNM